MKRHTALIPLSREHHGALILARLLQKNAPVYKGMPSELNDKAQYASEFYQEEIIDHFKQEERMMQMLKGMSPGLDLLTETIFREHKELHELFQSIKNHSDLSSHLDILGKALEIHVRKEERELFPLIQEICSEDMMTAIHTALSDNK